MKKNPFQKMAQQINRKLYNNPATLTYRIVLSHYDNGTGEMEEKKYIFQRQIFLKKPHLINDAVVDGKNYLKGDLSSEIAYLDIVESKNSLVGDPAVTIDGNLKTLADLRPSSKSNCGIDCRTDYITFCGNDYRIIKVNPINIYAEEPSSVKIQLREGIG